MRISDWSSDVCSSDLTVRRRLSSWATLHRIRGVDGPFGSASLREAVKRAAKAGERPRVRKSRRAITRTILEDLLDTCAAGGPAALRSEEHTSELQSLMRISYAVFCLKKKTTTTKQ